MSGCSKKIIARCYANKREKKASEILGKCDTLRYYSFTYDRKINNIERCSPYDTFVLSSTIGSAADRFVERKKIIA